MPRPPLTLIEGGAARRPSLAAAFELAALGTGLTLCMAWIGALPHLQRDLGAFQAIYAVAFAFLALTLVRRRHFETLPRVSLVVLTVAIAARVPLLSAAPSLSDDVYRYVWEGRVLVAGGNPYAQSPSDPALVRLADPEIHARVNHPELATIYPPLAEAGFALVAAVSDTVFAFKLWVVLHDVLLILVLMRLLARAGAGPLPVVAYAWNPLVIVEYAGSGHMEPTALLWLAVAWLAFERRPMLSAAAFSAAVLIKLTPLVALPFFLRAWPARARVTASALLATGLGAFWALTRGESSGLRAYWERWRNNDLVFTALERGLGGEFARLGAMAVVALAILWAWRRWSDVPAATRAVLRVVTVTAPVVQPWYLGWVLMAEPLRPSAPWLLLSFTAILNYGVLTPPAEGGAFHLPLGWRIVEYGLPLALGMLLVWRGRRARQRRD
jgi:hypothetical protein